jgi:uncharacterized protein YutE (UPF0331/DUF86 family)
MLNVPPLQSAFPFASSTTGACLSSEWTEEERQNHRARLQACISSALEICKDITDDFGDEDDDEDFMDWMSHAQQPHHHQGAEQ